MNKQMQVKRKHHYIWRFYLKQWASGNDIFYTTKKGKVACDSIRGLSRENDFYKINLLREADIDFLLNFSKKSPEHLQKQHKDFLSDYIRLSYVSNIYEKSDIKIEEIENIISVARHNSLENIHSNFERGVLPIMVELCKGSSVILNDDKNMIDFCAYLGQQITRTKAFKEKSIIAIKESPLNPDERRSMGELYEKNWWFLSLMFGLNIGFSLYSSRYENNHLFIVNNTNTPFITSDEPVINIHSSLKFLEKKEAPEELDLYFPLSPKYAYMINESSEYDEFADSIDKIGVQKLNNLIAQGAHQTMYGNSKEILESVKSALDR